MAARRPILILILAIVTSLLLAGCGSSSSSSVTPPAVSIALNPPPTTTTIPVANTTGVQFTPVVTNDPNNYGVDWAVTCSAQNPGGNSCGYLSICPPGGSCSLHTASGTAVTYFPPSVPYNSTGQVISSQNVNVTVFATADHTQNVTTALTISSYTSVLSGSYVFQVKGTDANGQSYQLTGVITLDGNGNVTSGKQTFNSIVGNSMTVDSTQANPVATGSNYFAGSTYFVGPDGRGAITLSNMTDSSGNLVSETFSLVVLSTSLAQIAELDENSGAGTLELQDTTAAAALPTGAYALTSSGSDNAGLPLAFGGVLSIDGSGNISGVGSLADQQYTGKLVSCPATNGISGTVVAPDSFGFVTISLLTNQAGQSPCLNPNSSVGTFVPTELGGYIVDATHIRLIETDDVLGGGGPLTALTAGLAVGQGTAAGTFTNASFTGPYVWGILGESAFSGLVPSSLTSAGVVNADGSGNIPSGITDTFANPGGGGNPAQALAAQFSGTYQVDAEQIGRIPWTITFPTHASFKPNFVAYLTGAPGSPALVLVGGALGSLGAGIAYPQAANAASLSFGNPQTYGISFTQQNGSENDGTGDITSALSGAAGILTGSVDDLSTNAFLGTGPTSIVDSFTPPADSFGRILGTFMNTPGLPGPYMEYYFIDGNQGFFIENDLITQPSGTITLGYFATSCDVTSSTSCQNAAKPNKKHISKTRSVHIRRGSSVTGLFRAH